MTSEDRRVRPTQGRLIVKDIGKQLNSIAEIGDFATVIVLGWKARRAMIAWLGNDHGFTTHNDQEFYLGIPVRMSTKCLGEWTAHVSSLHSDGTVARATTDDPSIVALRQLARGLS